MKNSAASSTCTANSHQRKNTTTANTSSQNNSNNNNSSSLDRHRRLSGCLFGADTIKDGGREQISSSHYSTEKSGSSGYYSSNIYSTSSVEDHIYSEPVIDVIDDNSRRRKFEQKLDQQIGLANLEKSIKTLEKHLKLLNKTNKKEYWQQLQKQKELQQHQSDGQRTSAVEQLSDASNADDEKMKRLPTIVEGMDNNVTTYQCGADKEIKRQNEWIVGTTDDSLHDLDLDTFLLIDETCDKKRKTKKTGTSLERLSQDGIENPTFESDHEHEEHVENEIDDNDVLLRNAKYNDNDKRADDGNLVNDIPVSNSDKNFENNYKCTKYINSCPDNAYNVEEIIDYKYEQPPHSPFASAKSMAFYMKNIEEHIQHQNTKDILEEIRDKLVVLLKPANELEHESSAESDGIGSAKSNSETDSLKRNINALKHDLDKYLVLMNQQNEMEIRAFCSGLSKNYKLLTMQHALGNRMRRSLVSTSDIGSELYSNRSFTDSSSGSHNLSHQVDYHQTLLRRKRRAKNQLKSSQKWKNQLRNSQRRKNRSADSQHENESIRCSSGSDSNFQLQRRHSDSICSSWDDDQQIMITNSLGNQSGSSQHGQSDNSVDSNAIVPIEVQTLLSTTQNRSNALAAVSSTSAQQITGHIEHNLAMQQPSLITNDSAKNTTNDEKDIMLEWHRNKPSIWQQYYGSKRLKYSNVVKKIKGKFDVNPAMSYVSRRNSF